MAYTKQIWVDGDATYPLSAARLEHIEQGIKDATDAAGDAVQPADLGDRTSDAVIEARKVLSTKFQFNVLDYGAVGDGTTDDLAAINAAVSAWRDAVTAGGGKQPGQLVFPSGYRFAVSAPVTIKPSTGSMTGGSIMGHGSEIVALTPMPYLLRIDSTGTTAYWRHWSMQGVTLRGGGLIVTCSADLSNNLYAWSVNDLSVLTSGLGHGIFVDNAYEGKIDTPSISHATGTEFSAIAVTGNASSMEVIGGVTRRGKYGIFSDGTDLDVFGTTVLNSDLEGIRMMNARGNVLSGVHVERVQQSRTTLTGHQPGVYAEGGITVTGAYIYDTATTGDRRMTHAVSVYATASGTPGILGVYSSNITIPVRVNGASGATAVVMGSLVYELVTTSVGVIRLGGSTTNGFQLAGLPMTVSRANSTDAAITVRDTSSTPRVQMDAGGAIRWAGFDAASDTVISRPSANLLAMSTGDSFRVEGIWNGGTLRLGDNHLWVDATGDLRIKNGAPTSDTDGVVVGTQS